MATKNRMTNRLSRSGMGILAFLPLLLLLACGPVGTQTPRSTQTAPATITAEPRLTPLPTTSPSPMPTPTLNRVYLGMIFGPPTATPTPQPSATPEPTPSRVPAQVLAVIDGDTIEVQIGTQVHSVRYIGIDSPERGAPGASAAAAANQALVDGQTVWLEKDLSETDAYDRLLRYVYLADGTFVNAELVGQGFATAAAYPPDTRYQDLFAELEQEAQSEQVGLWAPPPPTEPASSSGEPDVRVDLSCSQVNAPGNDNDNKSAEYVCLRNVGSASEDLSGWSIIDNYGWTYRFPTFKLAGGAQVRIHTGCGGSSSSDLYWCKEGTAVWNNDGDCVNLRRANGDLVSSVCY